jgi:3-dehydroquinate synthase
MVCAARLSERACAFPPPDTQRLARLVAAAQLPIEPPRIPVERWLDLMGRDKKVEGGVLRFVLLESIGHSLVRSDVDMKDVASSVA